MAADAPATLRDEPAIAVPATTPVAREREAVRARTWSPAAVAIWAVCAFGLVLFILVARVPIEAGWRHGRSMRVADIWSLFTLELSHLVPVLTPVLLTILVVVLLAGCLVLIWLAMSVTDDTPSERTD